MNLATFVDRLSESGSPVLNCALRGQALCLLLRRQMKIEMASIVCSTKETPLSRGSGEVGPSHKAWRFRGRQVPHKSLFRTGLRAPAPKRYLKLLAGDLSFDFARAYMRKAIHAHLYSRCTLYSVLRTVVLLVQITFICGCHCTLL